MNALLRICGAFVALFVAIVAAIVCIKLVVTVRQDLADDVPTMLFGVYQLDGLFGYFIPVGVGLIGLFCLGVAVFLIIPTREMEP